MADIPVNASPAYVMVDVVTNGQTVFGYDFRADFIQDLAGVYTAPNGTKTPIVGGVNFTASGLGTENGGNITLTGVATLAGGVVLIYRNITVSRVTDYTRDLFAVDINAEQDRVFMILQEVVRDLARGIRLPLGYAGNNDLAPEDGTILGWVGTDLVNLNPSEFIAFDPSILTGAIQLILPLLPTAPPVGTWKLWNNGGILSFTTP